MKLTVITINLNNMDGLVKTVNSVLEQSFSDFGFVIVDGASTDGSVGFIQDTANIFPGLIWVSEKDTGIFNAMNKGIAKAEGDYILFLNSGDYLVDKDVLAKVFEKERTSDILLGAERVSKHGEPIWTTYPKASYSLKNLYHGSIAHQAAFIRKGLFERYGLYREDLRFMGDWEFFVRTLIVNHCSLEPMDILVSDYDLEGMSSDVKNREAISAEKDKVYTDLGLDRIIIDYKRADEWLDSHKPMTWAWGKAYIRKPVEILFRIASKKRNQ